MGASESGLTLENIEEVQKSTNCIAFFYSIRFIFDYWFHLLISIYFITVTPKEIKRLYKRFQHLDKDSSGWIGTDDFLSIPELAMNPLQKRIIKLFDQNDDDKVSYLEFM